MSSEPSPAERARTAVANAAAATLVNRDCHSGRTLTLVRVEDQPDGCTLVRLDRDSPAVRALAVCPVATLVVPADPPFWHVHLVGTFRSVRTRRGTHGEGRLFRVSPLSARLIGAGQVAIAADAFRAAMPDPLREVAPKLIRHLELAHTNELLACVRAHGHDAAIVVPRGIDRYGLELTAIADDGVRRLRLAFPDGPVADLDQLRAGLRLPLLCQCGTEGD